MHWSIRRSWIGLFLLPTLAWGQIVIEAPETNQLMAGIRPFFGFVCEPDGQPSNLTAGFNGEAPTRIASGLDRADTKTVCNNDGLNGFVGFTNFNLLPQGENTFELYRDGTLVESVTFRNIPWSDGTEFIPGPVVEPSTDTSFDPAAPATDLHLLLSGFPHAGRAALARYDPTIQGLTMVSTRAQTDPGVTKADLVLLLGSHGIKITLPTDPPTTVTFPGKNAIQQTELGPMVTNSDGEILGALAAVFGDAHLASITAAEFSAQPAFPPDQPYQFVHQMTENVSLSEVGNFLQDGIAFTSNNSIHIFLAPPPGISADAPVLRTPLDHTTVVGAGSLLGGIATALFFSPVLTAFVEARLG